MCQVQTGRVFYARVSSTEVIICAHLHAAYEEESNRMGFNANISTFDLWDSYLVPYEWGFKAGNAAGSMCSYSSVSMTLRTAP